MKVKIKSLVERMVDVKTLQVDVDVPFWEDTKVNGVQDVRGDLIPCRYGDRWSLLIDLEKGQILNWKTGVKANVFYKVSDRGTYRLKSARRKTIVTKDDSVPNVLCPKAQGGGDYIIIDIDENGFIADWKPDLADFSFEE